MSFALCVLFKDAVNCGSCIALVVHGRVTVTVGRELNNTESGKQKYFEINLSPCHTVQHKSHNE